MLLQKKKIYENLFAKLSAVKLCCSVKFEIFQVFD